MITFNCMNKLNASFNLFCWIILAVFIALVGIFMLIVLPAIASFIFINFIGAWEADATFIQTFLYYLIAFNIYIFCLMPIVFSFNKIHKIIKTKAFNRKNIFKIKKLKIYLLFLKLFLNCLSISTLPIIVSFCLTMTFSQYNLSSKFHQNLFISIILVYLIYYLITMLSIKGVIKLLKKNYN